MILPQGHPILANTVHLGSVIPTVTTVTNPVVTDTASREASKADVSALATEVNATSNKDAVIVEVDENEVKIDSIKVKTDNMPADISTDLDIINKGVQKASKIIPHGTDI